MAPNAYIIVYRHTHPTLAESAPASNVRLRADRRRLYLFRASRNPLKYGGVGHPAPLAHRLHAIAAAGLLERVDEGR